MAFNNSPLNYTSIDLEIETIKRFRSLAPFLSTECLVFREFNGDSTILCLDFAACSQDLKMNKEEWREFAVLLAHSSNYLGLANSLVFKNGDRVVGWITLNQIA
ncbi:hypothetical protein [Mastigocoleus sp. MO_188.B34]|uniref:hypothetical protein n=1 Tax=Mastigocoleus sp. MO_188.B34 TaxID=3036635 RepID=UPI002611CD0D|nr:hypothetical protein [Mastigocoleus sp. MO_188.B34]MDJ0696706.1 hypothetical protein [Mastigocoleus sp. MO_188.B34]